MSKVSFRKDENILEIDDINLTTWIYLIFLNEDFATLKKLGDKRESTTSENIFVFP